MIGDQLASERSQMARTLDEDEMTTSSITAATSTSSNSSKSQQQSEQLNPSSACRHHHRKPTGTIYNLNRRFLLSGFVCIILAVFLLAPPASQQLAEGAKIKKAVKSIAKGLIFQSLSTKKNFLPLPVPIPGKPKYVNIYKPPKPTSAPIVKPTTVYHMPIYSPTYEYMSMDPMNAMYGAQMMYNPYTAAPSSYKSSVNTDSDSTSSVASATHGGASYGGMNFNDYDDESGSYYMKKSAARRRKLMPGEYASSFGQNLHRIDMDQQRAIAQRESLNQYAMYHERAMEMVNAGPHEGSNNQESDVEWVRANDDESYDHDDASTLVGAHHDSIARGRRVKRQVYYESGYDGNTNCEGFPLEINVRSRIKLDQIFPIHGKSQIKKCVKIKKTILPPREEYY